jgi:hypothetical protein
VLQNAGRPALLRIANRQSKIGNSGGSRLGDDGLDRLAKVDLQAFAAGDGQTTRIQPQLLEHRRVDIRDVMPMLYGMKA